MIPVQLLVFAVQTAVTTTVCIAEYLSWEHLTVADKVNLGYLYVPYLALCMFRFYFSFLDEGYSGIGTLLFDCGQCSLVVSRGMC